MELYIPLSEFEADHPDIGDFGEITLKVEVMRLDKEGLCVVKHGPIKISKQFKEIELEDLKNRIGSVEDTEMPMHKNKESE